MTEVTLFGFPRSVYVQMAGIVLTHKEVPYAFHDLEAEMNTPSHIAAPPVRAVANPAAWRFHGLRDKRDRQLCRRRVRCAKAGTRRSAAASADESVDQRCQWLLLPVPDLPRFARAQRVPQLGIPSDEKVVAHAMPKVEVCLQTLEGELSRSREFLLGEQLSLADFFMLPIIHAFSFAPEAREIYPRFPSICSWRERIEALPTMKRFRAAQPPRGPIEHARRWIVSHRPKY